MTQQRNGLFISADGIDCVGKTTQCDRLAIALRARGHDVVQVRSPGSTKYGKRIRTMLLDPKTNEGLTGKDELWLMVADRLLALQGLIEPALEKGKIVIADRWIPSTYVYQGVIKKLPWVTIWKIHQELQIPHPDIYAYFRVAGADQQGLVQQRIRARGEVFTIHDQITHDSTDMMADGYERFFNDVVHQCTKIPYVIKNVSPFNPVVQVTDELMTEILKHGFFNPDGPSPE